MARQTFSKGQHVWVKRPYGVWQSAIVAEPDEEQKGYSYSRGQPNITHHVRVIRQVNGEPTVEEFLVRNSRANIVTEERHTEIIAEKQAKEWYYIVNRQQQSEEMLAKFTEQATIIVETCGDDVTKLADYLYGMFSLRSRYGPRITPKQVIKERASDRKEAEEAKKKIRDAGLPEWTQFGQE